MLGDAAPVMENSYYFSTQNRSSGHAQVYLSAKSAVVSVRRHPHRLHRLLPVADASELLLRQALHPHVAVQTHCRTIVRLTDAHEQG